MSHIVLNTALVCRNHLRLSTVRFPKLIVVAGLGDVNLESDIVWLYIVERDLVLFFVAQQQMITNANPGRTVAQSVYLCSPIHGYRPVAHGNALFTPLAPTPGPFSEFVGISLQPRDQGELLSDIVVRPDNFPFE